MTQEFFSYGEAETSWLSSRDRRLGEAIAWIGHIDRPVDTDLFSSVVHHIVGQQISTRAQQTIWTRLGEMLGAVSPTTVAGVSREQLQSCGMTFRKADYIKEFSEKTVRGTFDLDAVAAMPDAEAIAALASLKGIGVWTAEMILLFCLQRPDILSRDDLAIQRGMRMLYRHRRIGRDLFERLRRRYSPFGSVASLYLWAVAGNLKK